MPGIYAFQAPSDPRVSSDRDIQLYYNTARQNLALTLKASSGSGQDTGLSYIAQNNNQKGVILDKTQLDSTIHNGVRLIVGLTLPEGGTTDVVDYVNYDVSIISPMYMPLAKSSTESKAVALCSDGEEAWVFYITGDDDNSRALSYTTVLGESESETIPGISRILNGTSLVAIYNTYKGTPLVYYQGRGDDLIYEYNLDSRSVAPIKSTNDALEGTPISLSLDVAGGRLYMYYTDRARKVRRISCVIKDSGVEWSPSMDVRGVNLAVSPSSQLGVAAVANKKQNHIFFVPENSEDSKQLKFVHHIDHWL